MSIERKFRGRIFQVIEALDYGDAVSNQVIELGKLMAQMGFVTANYSKWHHSQVENLRLNLDDLKPTDQDIVILHYAGYSEHALPAVREFRCTKICVYHNITPHTFFQPDTPIYDFCFKGRQQLKDIAREFHYFWGDSNYNLQEMIELGVDREKCALVPIVVKGPVNGKRFNSPREPGVWLFLGRFAANKGQIELVKLFASVRAIKPECAQKLYLVGGFQAADPYYQELGACIAKLKLEAFVVLTGKVPDAEVEQYFGRSSIYVSMSQHEGFGVPLIEAAQRNLPVLALRNTAIGETMGNSAGLADTEAELGRFIVNILGDLRLYQQILQQQGRNAERFSSDAVSYHLSSALRTVIPDQNRFVKVSVVICTYNRADLLERCLDYLQYQTNKNFEVVVINGPSTDNTETLLETYKQRIKIGRNPERNLSVSRNLGIELSDGELIAFIDDDALPFDDWVETLLNEFNSRPLTLAGLGGPAYFAGTLRFQSEDIGINKFAEAKVNIDSGEIGKNGWERSLLGTNTCFRADLIREIKGFDEQFDYFLDESDLCFRLQTNNYIVGYCSDLFLRHEFAQSHNRNGKYKYNWFTICKNTAYYIAAYSGLKGKELNVYIDKRMYDERILPLEYGNKAGEIDSKELDGYIDAIRSGAKQGLLDSKLFPRTRDLRMPPSAFLRFAEASTYPLAYHNVKRLHICVVTKEFPPFAGRGGIGTLYYHLVSELLLMGHFITVLMPEGAQPIYRCGRLAVHCVKPHAVYEDTLGAPAFTANINWSISAMEAVSKLHVSHPIDVIESALWDSETLAISLLPKSERPPLVLRLVTPFSVAARLNGWSIAGQEGTLLTESEKTLVANADAIVPISESIACTIETEYGICRDGRWVSSHCGIAYWPYFDSQLDYSELKQVNGQPLPVPKAAKLVLFVGRLESRKGVDVLLSAANKFLASDSSAHLVLAGRDVEDYVSRAKGVLEKNVTGRVHFLGEVDDSTRDKLLHASYCVVFPSRYESFGLVPLEAFVHGVPVVAARAGAIPEVVFDGACGLLFDVDDSDSLANNVVRLLSEPKLHERLAAGAKKQIHYFSSRKSAIRAIKLYSALVN
jgi:glycosyltransferase involved in cell wall biosynthesis